jgi:hypothetical protein
MSEEGMVMKGRKLRQPGLFEAVVRSPEPVMPHRIDTLALLGILLAEAVVDPGEARSVQTTGGGDDQDHP